MRKKSGHKDKNENKTDISQVWIRQMHRSRIV